MIELISASIAYKADNWSGDGLKMQGYWFLTIALLFPLMPFIASLGAWGLLCIPYVFVCVLCLRKWGAWGELFVNDKDNFDPKHKWFYRIVDKLYGEKYVTLSQKEKHQWKVLGWGVRYAIYGLPLSALYCYADYTMSGVASCLTPLFLMPIAGLIRGCVYWYSLENHNLKHAEQWGGALSMLVIAGSV